MGLAYQRQPMRDFFSTLFGSTDAADCFIVFLNDPVACEHTGASPRALGEPLPAHQLILRAGSERFRAQIERWTCSIAGHSGTKRGRDEPNGAEEGPPRLRIRLTLEAEASPCPDTRDSSRRLPELKVHLNSEDELQPVMAAIRFMYTGSLREQQRPCQQWQQQQQQGPQQGHGGSGGSGRSTEEGARLHVSQLVRIRRLADYLQVHGCAEACDEALAECFKERPDGGSDAGGSSSSRMPSGSPLAPVLELYSCQHLLPSPEDDPRVRAVLAACCKRLARHWGAPLSAGSTAQPSTVALEEEGESKGTKALNKVEVLAWLLEGGHAVRIANDPVLIRLWFSLSAAALEELLQSDHFSTDDEATVVAMVEQWVAAQGSGVTEADKARVRRQLRLVNCNPSYLFDVLPKLPWLGAQQAVFMARCRMTDRSQWQHLGGVLLGYDTSSPWYGMPRPQSVPEEGVSYRWEVSREELLEELKQEGDVKDVPAWFQLVGAGKENFHPVAYGLGWAVSVRCTGNQPNVRASLHLKCFPPPAIHAHTGRLQCGGCCLSACVYLNAPGTAKWVVTNAVVPYVDGLGWTLALEQGAGGQAAGGGQQQQEGAGEEAAGGEQQQQEGAGGQAAGGGQQRAGGQGEGSEEKTDEELLAPWAKLLGPEGKIRGELTFFSPGA